MAPDELLSHQQGPNHLALASEHVEAEQERRFKRLKKKERKKVSCHGPAQASQSEKETQEVSLVVVVMASS